MKRITYLLLILIILLALNPSGMVQAAPNPSEPQPKTPIKHLVVVMQENHSFDNYFGTYPGANGIPAGTKMPIDPKNLSAGYVEPWHIGITPITDISHSSSTYNAQYDNGKMDGFVSALNYHNQDGHLAMGYYDGSDIPYYWNLADYYVLFDKFFSSAKDGSGANHMFWVAGTSPVVSHGQKLSDLLVNVPTIFDRLQAAGVSWKFYVQNYDPTITYRNPGSNANRDSQIIWVSLLNFDRFLDDPALASHIVDLNQYYLDLRDGTLPSVAYIVPSGASEHPPSSLDSGQRFVKTLIQELQRSTSWNSSAFFLTYDDWGGWFDHVTPPQVDSVGYGARVPTLLVSPYALKGKIDSTLLDDTSFLSFIEKNWGIQPLTARDSAANNLMSAFDFNQTPRLPEYFPIARVNPPSGENRSHEFNLLGLRLSAIVFFASDWDCSIDERPQVTVASSKRGTLMKRRLFSLLLFSSLFVSGLLVFFVRPVSAQSQIIAYVPTPAPLIKTTISLSNITVQELGTPFNITGFLISQGKPVTNTSIVITLDGKYLGQASTDEYGQFLYSVHQDLSAGSYVIAAHYFGSRLLASANATTALKVSPSDFIVQTVPPIAGISFLLDGHQITSDADGIAKISFSKAGIYHLEVQADKYSNPDQRITFGRWQDEIYQPARDVQIPANGPLQVGFDVYEKVDQTFVDLDGNPVDPKRVTGITIKSAQGDIFNYQVGQHIWVPASRINRRSSGLETTQLLYSVNTVTVDGSNVVNKAQQRFFTGINDTWKISLTLYKMEITAKDALFGSQVGEAVILFYPNGKQVSFPFDKAGSVKLPALARGIYKIKLTGTKGVDTITPVALSRDQVVNQNVITYRDLVIVFGSLILLALGLIILGRPWLLFPRLRRLELNSPALNEKDPV